MRYTFTLLAVLLFHAAWAQQATIPFEKLAGTWLMQNKNGSVMGETWIIESKISMQGKSFLISKTDTTILEKVTLVQEDDGIYYIPVAIGQNNDKPVRFKLTAATETVYVFENPDHDFPKRIVYDFTVANEIHAYIDDGTDTKRRHFYYKKKK